MTTTTTILDGINADALSAAGFWVEDCTGWYSAVYEKEVAHAND